MKTTDKRVYLSPPHMNGGEMKYINEAFESNWVAPLGANVDAFEDAVKEYIRVPYALAVNSGTAAIHLALRHLGVGQGDAVFCSDVTFAASCNPIVYQQAEPVFIDCDMETWCMSPELLSRALVDYHRMGRLPKAVVVVDLYGLPADYGKILEICAQYRVPVVEDAAEALGSSYRGRMCGAFGDIGILSFNANKIITTSGGGMVLARDKEAVDKMRFWATQAKESARHYEHREIGYNYRLSNICAGIGRGQMEAMDSYVQARRRIYARYVRELHDLPVSFYPSIDGAEPNCWLSVMTLKEGCGVSVADIMDALERQNIESRPFWKPMHMQPVYRDCVFYAHCGATPAGSRLFQSSLCLPSGSAMDEDVQSEIINVIRECF
ncbi:MAG: DegT/DnrJ/EryC1/StrS family aminotransferase [Bacillota bacterium]